MTDADRQRLAAILGMLGSEHQGERDNAARQAEAFRQQHGLTWEGILSPIAAAQPKSATAEPFQWPPYPDSEPPPHKPRRPPLQFEWGQVALRVCFWVAIVSAVLVFR